ncbi:MAG: hypothetical protein J6Y20_07765 [Lachnospiraceae bacterium]|nr:hypothetical protein [Lachnospiraceae bacterium]
MSIRDYGVNDYGLLLREDTMKRLASAICKDYTEEEYLEDPYSFNEVITDSIAEYIFNFTGEAVKIRDNGEDDWMTPNCSEYYDDDFLYYIPLSRYPSLFNAAYTGIGEVVEELKRTAGRYLPSDFDYRSDIRHIIGTYYG